MWKADQRWSQNFQTTLWSLELCCSGRCHSAVSTNNTLFTCLNVAFCSRPLETCLGTKITPQALAGVLKYEMSTVICMLRCFNQWGCLPRPAEILARWGFLDLQTGPGRSVLKLTSTWPNNHQPRKQPYNTYLSIYTLSATTHYAWLTVQSSASYLLPTLSKKASENSHYKHRVWNRNFRSCKAHS